MFAFLRTLGLVRGQHCTSRGKGSAPGLWGIESLESRQVLSGSPVVLDVTVSSTDWTPEYIAVLESAGLGIDGYSIPTGSEDQSAPLPWNNLNQIRVKFSDDVVVKHNDLSVTGVDSRYQVADFSYDEDSRTGVWSLAEPIGNDRVLLQLYADGESLRSRDGVPLDGDWTDETDSLPSGDGQPGGDFQFTIIVSHGDVDRNAETTRLDYVSVDQIRNSSIGDSNYDPLRDIDGTGDIGFGDLAAVMEDVGATVPDASPIAGSQAPSISFGCMPVGGGIWWLVGSVSDPDDDVDGWGVDMWGAVNGYETTDLYGNFDRLEDMSTHRGDVFVITEDPDGNESNLGLDLCGGN